MTLTIPPSMPWSDYAQTVMDAVTPGRTYMLSEMAAIVGITMEDKDAVLTLIPCLTYLSTAPEAILDSHLLIHHNGEPVILDLDQHSTVMRQESFLYKGKTYSAANTYMAFKARAEL